MKRLLLLSTLFAAFSFADTREALSDGWQYIENVSPIDDSSTHVIAKEFDSTIFSGASKAVPVLGVSCYPSKDVVLMIGWGTPMDIDYMDGSMTVTIRIDKEKAIERKWIPFGDKSSVYPEKTKETREFIATLVGKEKMLISGKPMFGLSDHAFLSLDGLGDAIKTLYSRCGVD